MKSTLLFLAFLVAAPLFLFAKEFKDVPIKTENAGTIIFSHEVHLKKVGANCTKCHNTLFQVSKKNPTVTMAEMETGKSCGACHDDKTAFSVKGSCIRCHAVEALAIKIPNFGAVPFNHQVHLKTFSCGDCHSGLFVPSSGKNPHVTMAAMEKGASCGACHDDKTAFTVKANCTRCHPVKDIPFAADALFSHQFHLGIYACADCHSGIFVAAPKTKRYTMLDMELDRSCGACHDGAIAFSVKTDCIRCHKNQKEIPYKKSDALFSHTFHLGIYRCNDCHSGIFQGGTFRKTYPMGAMEQGRSCGACHDGSIAFTVAGSCDRCHKSTKEVIYRIRETGPVTFSHTVHTGTFKCDDCHNAVFTTGAQRRSYTMAEMEKGKSCGACHEGKTAFAVADCARCHPVKEINYPYSAVFSHTKHIAIYRCNDCHRGIFLPTADNKRRTMVDMEKARSCGACHDGGIAFNVTGDCGKCHTATVEVAMKVPATGMTPFSHKLHTGLFACGDCHNAIFPTGVAAKRFTMKEMEGGKSCGACHDGKAAFTVRENCDKCHPVKEIRFKDSGASFSHKIHIGLYRCDDCHSKIYTPGPGNRRVSMGEMEEGTSCGSCHDGKSAFTVKENCARCHPVTRAFRYEMPRKDVGDAMFSHKVHLSRGYGCADCHYKIVPTGANRKVFTMREMGEGKSCGTCHGFSMAFSVTDQNNCEKCHVKDIP